jgi:outer membrane protein assembly factor BamB
LIEYFYSLQRQKMFRRVSTVFGLILFAFNHASSFLYGDWPGILGPTRNGIADLNTSLPTKVAAELTPKWTINAGQGYAGAAIAGDQVVVFERIGEKDKVQMLALSTGKQLWMRELQARYKGGIDSDKGPRSVPTILTDYVLVYSAAGELTCMARKDGSVKWTRGLRAEYQGDDGYFGAGSTPLVAGDRIIVNCGGKKASIVCLSLLDGKTIWTASQGEASYASPILFSLDPPDSKPIVIVPTRLSTVGLDLDSGKELWQVPFGQRGPTVNAATPIATKSGRVFLTSSYGIGTVHFKPTRTEVVGLVKGEQLYSQYVTPISLGDRIFGCDGREDMGGGTIKCLAESDGSLIWQKENMPISHVIGVKNQVLIHGIDGQITCLDATSSTFSPVWTTKLPKGLYRALPAVSGRSLVVKSCDPAKPRWICVEW